MKHVLTLAVALNTIVAIFNPEWPPHHADKVMTILIPLMIWATAMAVELCVKVKR